MIKLIEAALPMHTSHDALRGQLRTALMLSHGVTDTYSNNGPYVHDVYPGHVVYSMGGQMNKRTYKADATANPPKFTLGDPKKVHAAYVDAIESAGSFLAEATGEELGTEAKKLIEATAVVITDDEIQLVESITVCDNTTLKEASAAGILPVKIIGPGWGSSGYYSADVLKRDGPALFKEGMHMHWDHQTPAEEKAKPERSMKTLAAVLNEDAKWMDNGPKGAGLYSTIKPFVDYAPKIKETAKYTGVSINARGRVKMGEAEGRKGPIIEALTMAKSTDFVTHPGRDGRVLLESAAIAPTPVKETVTMSMTEQETTSLREAQTKAADLEKKNAALVLGNNQAIAAAHFITAFQEAKVNVKMEAVKLLAANPPLKENGELNVDAIKATAKVFLESFSGGTAPKKGKINLGGDAPVEESDDAANAKELGGYLQEMGLSESAVKIAMKGAY